jgi:hypothetical protein
MKNKFTLAFLIVISTLLHSCKKSETLIPDDTDTMIGEYIYKGIDNSYVERNISFKISDAGYQKFNIELSVFPGPFHNNPNVSLNGLKVNFKNIAAAPGNKLFFEQVKDATQNNKVIYRANFRITFSKFEDEFQLNITTARVDIQGSTLNFNYMVTKI